MKKTHKRLLEEIEKEASFTAIYTGREAFSERVMTAMADVIRDEFVSENYKAFAYDNSPLPIGYGQTISQPYIVALMTDMLDLTPGSRVLEIGTGSGYQSAVLSHLAKNVYTIERVKPLVDSARERLQQLGYDNIEVRCSNGYEGWQEEAPFDGIIVTAAASHIPPALIEQLKPGGRMVVPIGLPYMHQELILLTKDKDGTTHTESILGVAFVPLITDEPTLAEDQSDASQADEDE
jgi:protein-L-isoaspartate(D-aspartate) O-methyltransferase